MLKKALLSAVAFGVLAGSAMAQDVKVLRIGLDGSENASDQLRNAQCVADGLKVATGVPEVQIFPSPDYNGVIQGLLGGTIDIASMGASSYAKIALQDPKAVDPILTYTGSDGSSGYYTIMVARKDSGIKTLADAKGKPAYDVWEYAGDSGTMFEVGTTKEVACIIQGSVECANEALRDAFELAVRQRAPKAKKVAA